MSADDGRLGLYQEKCLLWLVGCLYGMVGWFPLFGMCAFEYT